MKLTVLDNINNHAKDSTLSIETIKPNLKKLYSIDFYKPNPFDNIVNEIINVVKSGESSKSVVLAFRSAMWFNSDLFLNSIKKCTEADLLLINAILDECLK